MHNMKMCKIYLSQYNLLLLYRTHLELVNIYENIFRMYLDFHTDRFQRNGKLDISLFINTSVCMFVQKKLTHL
jgi:hypothetical protein